MERPILISLNKHELEGQLIKIVNQDALKKTFDGIYEDMMNGDPDELNPGYNAADRRVQGPLKELYDDPHNILILHYIPENELKPKRVELDHKLSDYPDLVHKVENFSSDIDTPYDRMLLYCSFIGEGGNGN